MQMETPNLGKMEMALLESVAETAGDFSDEAVSHLVAMVDAAVKVATTTGLDHNAVLQAGVTTAWGNFLVHAMASLLTLRYKSAQEMQVYDEGTRAEAEAMLDALMVGITHHAKEEAARRFKAVADIGKGKAAADDLLSRVFSGKAH